VTLVTDALVAPPGRLLLNRLPATDAREPYQDHPPPGSRYAVSMRGAKTLKNALGRMTLFARASFVFGQPLINLIRLRI
jgi:hypothetical protein